MSGEKGQEGDQAGGDQAGRGPAPGPACHDGRLPASFCLGRLRPDGCPEVTRRPLTLARLGRAVPRRRRRPSPPFDRLPSTGGEGSELFVGNGSEMSEGDGLWRDDRVGVGLMGVPR